MRKSDNGKIVQGERKIRYVRKDARKEKSKGLKSAGISINKLKYV